MGKVASSAPCGSLLAAITTDQSNKHSKEDKLYTPVFVSNRLSGFCHLASLMAGTSHAKKKKCCRIFVSEVVHLSCQIPKISGTDARSD